MLYLETRKKDVTVRKKLCIFLAMVVAAVTCLMPTVAAENRVILTISGAKPARAGLTFEVSVRISENSYMVNGNYDLTYDPAVVELVSNAYAGNMCRVNQKVMSTMMVHFGLVKPGDFRFVAATGNRTGITAGGEMFRVTFRLLNGEQNPKLNLKAAPLRGNKGNTFDANGKPKDYDIDYTVEQHVLGLVPPVWKQDGDTDLDGKISLIDVMMAFLHVNGSYALTPAQQAHANVNGGALDLEDVYLMFQLISGQISR